MRLVAVSDTHSYHRRVAIPEGDVFICAGDISFRGELEILLDFINWVRDLPHCHKVVIFGNHEVGMQSGPNRGLILSMLQDAGAIYLENNGTMIDGLHFWGSPVQPEYFNWEWNLPRDGQELKETWDLIPDQTNVLITHGPPYRVLDDVEEKSRGPQGCKLLKKKVLRLPNLFVHFYGHLHRSGGQRLKLRQTIFANVAICDDKYNPCRSATIIDL